MIKKNIILPDSFLVISEVNYKICMVRDRTNQPKFTSVIRYSTDINLEIKNDHEFSMMTNYPSNVT